MTRPQLLGDEELPRTERSDSDMAALCVDVVRTAAVHMALTVETPSRAVVVDGWLSEKLVVWHVAGDDISRRRVMHALPSFLPSDVGRMVGLGPRTRTSGEPCVRTDSILAAVRAGETVLDVGVPRRMWSWSWQSTAEPMLDPVGISVVDSGAEGSLWAVARVEDGGVVLRPVSPVEIWARLGEPLRYQSGRRGVGEPRPVVEESAG